MGLEIWAVKSEYRYLERPAQPVYDFLFDLLLNSDTGLEDSVDGDDTWGGSWENCGLYEFTKDGLRERADNWAMQRKLNPVENADLSQWIANLPWEDDHVTLMLGN